MGKQKRKVRAYKISDLYYEKAMKRAKREKVLLAQMVESMVASYSVKGTEIMVCMDGKYATLSKISTYPTPVKLK